MSWWLGLGLVGAVVLLMLGAALDRVWLLILGICVLVVTLYAKLLLDADTSDHQHALRDTRVVRAAQTYTQRAPCVTWTHDAPARVVLPACADLRALSARRDRRDA